MGLQDLQSFLAGPSLEGGSVSVDLLKIARNVTHRQQPQFGGPGGPAGMNRKIRPIGNKLKLIMDAECCLDRLYGGFFSDWACGGQWNRMVQFLSLLMQAVERGNIELAVVFNGTAEPRRLDEWIHEQMDVRQKVQCVLKHINTKGTPPPKVWWIPPTGIRTALRMALRHLNTTVMCTMDDHHQEVIAYCREYGFHGLLGDDPEYATFDPPRYFSSEHIKLTYKGSLETKEYMLSEFTKTLQLSNEQVCVVAALLGSYILPESEMQDIHRIIALSSGCKENKLVGDAGIKAIAEYVRSLPPPSDMDSMVNRIFPSDEARAELFRHTVQYYLNGTANGFLKYCNNGGNRKDYKKKGNNKPNVINGNNKPVIGSKTEEILSTVEFASETTEQEQESLQNYKLATANAVISSDIVIGLSDSDKSTSQNDEMSPPDSARLNGHSDYGTMTPSGLTNPSSTDVSVSAKTILASSSSSNTSNSVPTSPKHATNNTSHVVKPQISADVLRTASLRHQKGLMDSMILHLLSTQEVRLPYLLEDENFREFPPIHDTFRLLRQRVYAVLLNLHHVRYVFSKKKENGEVLENLAPPDIVVKEWVYNRNNPYQNPDIIKAEPLPWAVPTLHRLWFGPSVDDKRRRMRALLSCLNSDTPLILNTSYVPQHMLIMSCVLRYIMSQPKPILRQKELDAFLCHAYCPDLMNAQYLQELTLNVLTTRGVQLAAMFNEGVKMALLANDACGAPLPWLMCCQWLYFDGKLFNYTLARSAHAKSLLELCENHIDRVVKVERMRKAILEGLNVQFAKPPLPPPYAGIVRHQGLPPPCNLPTLPLPSTRGAAGLRQRPIPSRGGQLQIAGVVVGSWGANYGYMRPPQLPTTTVGRGRGFTPPFQRGAHQQRKPGPPTYPVNKKNTGGNKRRVTSNKQRQFPMESRGRGLTLETANGDILASQLLANDRSDEETIYADCNTKTSVISTVTEQQPQQQQQQQLSQQQPHHQGQGDGPPPIAASPSQ